MNNFPYFQTNPIFRWNVKLLLLSVAWCTTAVGQVSENYDLSWSVLSGGGGLRISSTQSIHDAFGQTTGAVSDSTATRIESGFIVGDRLDYVIEGEPEGEGETPHEGEGETTAEGEEGEPSAEGEGETIIEGEGETPAEGEGESEGEPDNGCCGGCECSGNTKVDIKRFLGDYLIVSISVLTLLLKK